MSDRVLSETVQPVATGPATETATHCPHCALQCGLMLNQDPAGAWSVSARDFPTNKGGLCWRGWTAAALLDHPDRLTTPLIRDVKGGPLRPATWDEALDRVAAGIGRVQALHGPYGMAVFGAAGLANETVYLLGKFARLALQTGNIDHDGRFRMSAVAGLRAYGIDRGLPFPLDDIPGAEAILIAGSDPAESMPPIMQYFEAQRARGGRLIVADPRRTATAELADLHLALTPGTDAALANGILNVAIRARLIDARFIAGRTTGWDAVRRAVSSCSPDRVERITGVAARDIERAAHMLGEAATAMVLSGRGLERRNHQDAAGATAFINLTLALGRAGRKHCGWGCLPSQGNDQGGREHGQQHDQLPGYRNVESFADRAAVAAVWEVDPATVPLPGLPAAGMLQALAQPDGVQGMLVVASDLALSVPDAARLSQRLSSLELLVVLDQFLTTTASLADVVLPVPQWAEESGTMTNLEGRVIRRRAARPPPPDVWTAARILSALAARLGCTAAFPADPDAVFTEFRRATAGGVADYAGMSPDRIAGEQGLFWPCPDEAHPGTPRLFLDRFGHPDGRARFTPVSGSAAAEEPDAAYPLHLATSHAPTRQHGRAALHAAHRAPTPNDAEPDVLVEIHPDTAASLGLRSGAPARITTRRGSAVFAARLTADIRRDMLFVPFHGGLFVPSHDGLFVPSHRGGASDADRLTLDNVDPVSHTPELKVCAARIEAAPATA